MRRFGIALRLHFPIQKLPLFLRDLAHVRDLLVANCSNRVGGNGDNCQGVSGETDKFHFVAGAFVMDQDYGPNIARLQSVLAQVSRQHYSVKF